MNVDTGEVKVDSALANLLKDRTPKQTEQLMRRMQQTIREVPDKNKPTKQSTKDAHKRLVTWDLGEPVKNLDQLAIATAVLHRLKKAAKVVSEENRVTNKAHQALCREAINAFHNGGR